MAPAATAARDVSESGADLCTVVPELSLGPANESPAVDPSLSALVSKAGVGGEIRWSVIKDMIGSISEGSTIDTESPAGPKAATPPYTPAVEEIAEGTYPVYSTQDLADLRFECDRPEDFPLYKVEAYENLAQDLGIMRPPPGLPAFEKKEKKEKKTGKEGTRTKERVAAEGRRGKASPPRKEREEAREKKGERAKDGAKERKAKPAQDEKKEKKKGTPKDSERGTRGKSTDGASTDGASTREKKSTAPAEANRPCIDTRGARLQPGVL